MSIAAQKHHACPTCRCGEPLPDSLVRAMTDPTPTRAEVTDERLIERLRDMGIQCCDLAADRIPALRERAEAAERDRLLMAQKYDEEHPDPALMATIIMRNIENRFVIEDLQTALTEARRAEAAAWNDAIEAVRPVAITCFASGCDAHELDDDIRALRRAATTEGEA